MEEIKIVLIHMLLMKTFLTLLTLKKKLIGMVF